VRETTRLERPICPFRGNGGGFSMRDRAFRDAGARRMLMVC
jgi:hypothetical protein